MNVLYRHIRALLCALCLLVCASAQTANVYPISLTASLLPPYSNCLGDYMSGSMDRVNVMAVMKDMSNPTGVYDIQLRMVVRQGNTRYIEASAKPHNSVTFSVARDGRMKRLSNAGRLLDPANASISYSRYAKNGYCLPEGAYQIEFQAFDNRFPTLPLSEPYTLHVYLGETEPPVPVYPANNTCVPNTSGQITFSWMERTVPHISPTKKYRLQVFEVPAGAATNAVAVSEPYKRVDEVVGGTTTFATIQQTAGTFVSGHTYVWRVRSFDDADKDNNTSLRYKNQGWSDTASFRFDRCLDEGFGIVEAEGECDDLARPAIAGVETSADAALVEWTADSGSATPPDLFRIAYCLAGDSLGLWTSFDKHTGDLATLAGTGGTTVYALPLRGLEPGVAYRVRVCAVRSGADGTAACHSEADSAEFRMPLAAGTVLADCDRSVPALQCTTALTKENAPKAGDHINANGQDVKILSIEAKGEGAATRFSGQGTTTFPFLKNKLSLLVDFRDIQISCANELMKGEIVTHWDPEHNANLDFNALLNNNNMGTGPAPQQKQFTSGDTATLKSGIAYVEKGANTGDVYAIGADGKVEKVAESLECTGVSTSALDYEAGTVVFEPGDGQLPPFDRNSGKFQNADIRNYYTRYGTYDVPWVAVVSGKTATLRAAFNANTDGTPVDTSKIYFVCKTQYQTVKLKSRNLGGGQYEVTVFGDKPQERLDIYAMCGDTSGNCLKALTLGKALVMTMAQRRETLVLVPVGQNAPKVDTAAIKRTLDGIYLPLGVDYTVRADKPFYTSELDGLLEEGLGITGAGLFKEETDDMRYLQSLYRQERGDSIDNTAAYIFILPKASVDGVKGDMPLTRPVGYVFASGDTYADGQTIAHELGHGLYSFQHAFDYMGVSQGETDNLMDYGLPQGEHLAVWQWNLISTHKNYTIPFLTDDEDGWLHYYNLPQLVAPNAGSLRKFYERLINEMFDLNKEKYAKLPNGNEFNSELDTLRKFVLGEAEYLQFDWIVQYLYHLADTCTILKKAARDYALASTIILTAAYRLGEDRVKLTSNSAYDFKTNSLELNNVTEEKMNFISIDRIKDVQNPSPESIGEEKWKALNNIQQNMTKDISEHCNFYTLLHECVHILYHKGPKGSSRIKYETNPKNNTCGCKLKGPYEMTKGEIVDSISFCDMANFRLVRHNYDATIKTENYFRVNLGGENKVRTSFSHHGEIKNQKLADLVYLYMDCYKQWCNPYKYKQVEYFMPITHDIYKLTSDFMEKIDNNHLQSLNGTASKRKFIEPQNNERMKESFKKHYKSVENQKYKNILKLE